MDSISRSYADKGFELGKKLANGEAKDAHTGYDALISRIQDETKNDPKQREADLNALHSGMAAADPTDVKSPGNGTDKGFYVYWNTEDLVTQAIGRVTDYCKSHSYCEGVGYDPSRLPMGVQDAAVLRNMSPEGNAEFDSMLQKTNNWLFESIPDGLERWVFNENFNRRRPFPQVESHMTDSLTLELFRKRLD